MQSLCKVQVLDGMCRHSSSAFGARLAHLRAAPSRPPTPPPGVEHESQVDRTLSPHVKASLLSVRDWRGYRNPWMPEGGAELVLGP